MGKKKIVLGRGLNALLGNNDESLSQGKKQRPPDDRSENFSVHEYVLETIEANPFQPRKQFNQNALKELADSIRVHGIIQPVTLKKLSNHRYQLIAGERRYHAAKLAGLDSIPAYVRDATSREMLEMALIENIQRENLNPIEIALSYQRLITDTNVSQGELGNRVSKDRSTVTNYLRLLKLPPSIQASLRDQKITMGHARALISVEKTETQLYLLERILSEELSVRATEILVRQITKKKPAGVTSKKHTDWQPLNAAKRYNEREVTKMQTMLSSHFGTRVKILVRNERNEKGEIRIPFLSANDLNRIIAMIKL